MPSPTQRTLALLRKEGYVAWIVEKWNAFARKRVDLFGFADVLAIKEYEHSILAIQTTSRSNAGSRRKKLLESKLVKIWLSTGNRVELWTWGKQGKRGKRKLWTVNREVIHGQA